MYAPKGVGALWVRPGLALEPQIHGPGHEAGLRGGTQNVASIVGLGRAASLVRESLEEQTTRLAKLRERLLHGLCATLGQPLTVYGEGVHRLANTLCLCLPGVSADELLQRAGEVCASPLSSSPLLAAMGVSSTEARGALRLSVGWYTTEEEVDRAIAILSSTWESLRA
jgi:cysteine desulfurase